MKSLSDKKVLFGSVALVALLIYAYFNFFRSTNSDEALLTSNANSEISSDLLVLLSTLHTIRLDNSFFADEAFLSLSDYGVDIDPQNVGRQNPFAPPSPPPSAR